MNPSKLEQSVFGDYEWDSDVDNTLMSSGHCWTKS